MESFITMSFQQLPLELVRLILAEAMKARGLRRALRLRLVNKLFATEVVDKLGELRMLDDVQELVPQTGPIGAAYLRQAILSERTGISPWLLEIQRAASYFAAEDEDNSGRSYTEYVEILITYLANAFSGHMSDLVFAHTFQGERDITEYNLMSAAAYVGKLSVIQRLSGFKRNRLLSFCAFDQPPVAAVVAGQTAAIDLILQQAKVHGDGVIGVWHRQLEAATRTGSVRVVEHLLASGYNPGLGHKRDHPNFEAFLRALKTPSVEVFDLLMKYKDTTLGNRLKEHKERRPGEKWITPMMEAQIAPLTESELAPLLLEAASNGWTTMASRLLDIGAPIGGDCYGQGRDDSQPLLAACKSDSEGVVEMLLKHDAKITGLECEAAAKRGRMGTVRILLEHGADGSRGDTPPIVSAVKLEYKEMFHLLWKHGVDLAGTGTGAMAVEEARKARLDSMLVLLELYGVDVKDGVVAGIARP